MSGIFLTVEGIEGVGKSTAVKFIQAYLIKAKQNLVLTREPGGTPIAEKIRQILLSPDHEEIMMPETELLLMFAARAQHIQKIIKPALQSGSWVISDRFIDASYAYQGGGRKIDFSHIEMLEKWIVNDVKPNITILLDAPPGIGLARAKNRGPHDRIEQEKMDFFDRVREGYLRRATNDSSRFRVIDATQSLTKVQIELTKILDELIIQYAT
jgi:dTMP kinase